MAGIPKTVTVRITTRLKRFHPVPLVIFGAVLLIYLFGPAVVRRLTGIWGMGSMDNSTVVAAVEALFSALAFGGIIYTVLLQRDELALQREELEATREELKGQKDQLTAQSHAMIDQGLTDKILRLLALQLEVVNSVQYRTSGSHAQGEQRFSGRDALRIIAGRLGYLAKSRRSSGMLLGEAMKEAFATLASEGKADYVHLLRHLQHVLQVFDGLPAQYRHSAIRLLQAQLSDAERLLALYYGIAEPDRPKFQQLVEATGVLSGVPEADLSPEIENEYNRSAFQLPDQSG